MRGGQAGGLRHHVEEGREDSLSWRKSDRFGGQQVQSAECEKIVIVTSLENYFKVSEFLLLLEIIAASGFSHLQHLLFI